MPFWNKTKMNRYLIDANVLIAATVSTHVFQDKTQRWLQDVRSVLLCPVVEGSLFRYVIRGGGDVDFATALLRNFTNRAEVVRIPDDLHYDEARWEGVTGHRQVTDVYLTELARRYGALLATLDQGIARMRPKDCFLIQ